MPADRRPLPLIAGAACLALAASADAQTGGLDAQITRGHDLARTVCASCHDVEANGPSPNRRAPPFRILAGHYVELTLHMKLVEIAETGHYDMPPIAVHSDQVRDLAAYINSLPRP